MKHLSDHDLERYHLGMVTDIRQKRFIEDHVITCALCAAHAEEAAEYVDVIRAAIIAGDFESPE